MCLCHSFDPKPLVRREVCKILTFKRPSDLCVRISEVFSLLREIIGYIPERSAPSQVSPGSPEGDQLKKKI